MIHEPELVFFVLFRVAVESFFPATLARKLIA
jgi:hypothetical protein